MRLENIIFQKINNNLEINVVLLHQPALDPRVANQQLAYHLWL
jgi:hypothetical protein